MLKLLVVLFAALLGAPSVVAQHHEVEDQKRMAHLFSALDVRPGAVIADVGAGDGAYSVELAKAVGPTGRVLAVDISPRALERLRARIARTGASNIDVIEGAVDDPRLPAGSVDAILVVHAYHEMTEYAAMLARMREALTPAGRLVIVEPISPSRRQASREVQTRSHQLAAEYAHQEVRSAGFRMVSFADPMPSDHGHEGHSEWLLAAQPDLPVTTKSPSSVRR